MTGDVAGAVLDFGYIVAMWFPGILLIRAIGLKNTWASLTVGFLTSAVVVIILFHMTALVQATHAWWFISKIVLLALLVATVWISVRKQDRAVLTPLGVALAISAIAVIARNIFRLDGRFRGPDQFLVGWISSLAQSGHDPEYFGGSDYIKRGFALPLLLAQGREGQLLLSITIVIILLALISTFVLASSIGTKWNLIGISLGVALIVVWFTTPIVWGMAFYINGHVLMALAVATLASHVVSKDPTMPHSPPELATVFVAGFTLASTRPEGVVLALILSFPLFVKPLGERRRDTSWRLVAILGAPLAFVMWFETTNFFGMGLLPSLVISAGLITAVIGLFFALYAKVSWHLPIAMAAGGILLAAAISQLLGSPPGLNTLTVFVNNSFLGVGWWGVTPWLFIGVFIVHALFRSDKRVTMLVTLTAFAVAFTIAVKIVDGIVEIGGIPGLSLGWFDSVNRAFFHLIALPSALFLRLGLHVPALSKPREQRPTSR